MRAAAALFVLAASAAGAQDSGVAFRLTFDPDTTARLQAMGERVVVAAVYYGEPKAGATVELDEMGQVWLGNEDVTVDPLDQDVALKVTLEGEPVDQVEAPMMNVNVFTARIAHRNNLIECDLIDGPVADVAKQPKAISCTLLRP
jgi:hypothetical protein